MTTVRHGPIRRGTTVVLQPGSLALPKSGVVGVVGANGSGKSTLLLALAGVLGGAVNLSVAEPPGGVEWKRPRFLMPQSTALPGWLSGRRVASLFDTSLDDMVGRFPGLRLGETRDVRADRMSGGQRQALMLSLALASGARMLLLDEPFASLDLPRRAAAVRLLGGADADMPALPAGQLTMIASHSVADVADMCEWYVVLDRGRYAFSGPVADLLGPGWQRDPDRQRRLEQGLLALSGFPQT